MNPSGKLPNNPKAAQVTVIFQIASASQALGLNTDESYSIEITSPSDTVTNIQITAPTYFGEIGRAHV